MLSQGVAVDRGKEATIVVGGRDVADEARRQRNDNADASEVNRSHAAKDDLIRTSREVRQANSRTHDESCREATTGGLVTAVENNHRQDHQNRDGHRNALAQRHGVQL